MHAPMVTHVCVLGTTKRRPRHDLPHGMHASPRTLRDLEAYWRHGERERCVYILPCHPYKVYHSIELLKSIMKL